MSNSNLVVLTDVADLHVEPGLIGKDAPVIATPKASAAFKPILLRRQIPATAAPTNTTEMSKEDQDILPALLSSLIHQLTAEEFQSCMPSLPRTGEVYTTQAFQATDGTVQIGFFSDQDAYTRQTRPAKFLTIPRSDFEAHKQTHATKPQQEDLLFTLQDDLAPVAATRAPDKAATEKPEPFVEPIHGEEIARLNSLQLVLNAATESLNRDLKRKSDEALASSCKDLLQIKAVLARYKTSVKENKDLQNSTTTKPFILKKIEELQAKIDDLTKPPLTNLGNIQGFYDYVAAIKAEVDEKHKALSEELFSGLRHEKGLIALTEFSQQLSTILGKKEQVEQNVLANLPQYKQVSAVQTTFTSLQTQIKDLSLNIAAYSNAPTKEIPAKFFDTINSINRELETLIQTCNDSSSSATREFIPKLYQLKSTVAAVQTTFFSINRKETNPERYVGQSLGDNWAKKIASLTQKARTWGGKKDREITENVVASITKLISLMGNNDPSSEFLDGFRKYVVSSNKPAWIRLITPGDKFIVSKERQQQIQDINNAITGLLTGKKTTVEFLQTLIAIRSQITEKNSRLHGLLTKEISRLTGSFVNTMKAALAPNVEPKQNYSPTFITDLDHLLFVLQQDRNLKLDGLQTLLGADQLPKAYQYLSKYIQNKLIHSDEIQYQQCDLLAQCLIDIYQRTPETERSSYKINEPDIDISRNSLFGLVLNKSLTQLAEVRVAKKPETKEAKKTEIDEKATAETKEAYITKLIANIQTHWDINLHREILALAIKSEFSFLQKTEGFWQQYLTFLASKKEEIKDYPDLNKILAQKAQDYALEETLTKFKSGAFRSEEAFLLLSGPTVSFLGKKYPNTYSGYQPKDLEDKVQKARESLASSWPLRIIETRRGMVRAKAYELLEQGFEEHKKTLGNNGAKWLEYFHAHESECELQAHGDPTINDAAAERKLIEQLGGRDLSDLQDEAEKTTRYEANLSVIKLASCSIDHILLDENHTDGILRLLGTIETNPQLWKDVLSAHSAEYEMRDQYGDTPPVQTRTHEYLRLHHLYGLTTEEKTYLAMLSNQTEGYVRIRNDLFREINIRNKDAQGRSLSPEVVGKLADAEIARQIKDLSEQQQRATMPTLVKKVVAALITSGKFSTTNPTGKSLIRYLDDGKIFELTVRRQNQTTLKFEDIKYTYGSPEEIVGNVIDYYQDYYQTQNARKKSWDFVFTNESDYSYEGSNSEAFKAILEWAEINVTAASPEKSKAATQIIVFAEKIILEQIGSLEKMIASGHDANRLNTLFKHPIVQLYLSITSDTSTLEQAISQYVSKLFPYENSQILQILIGKLPILSIPWKSNPQKPEELVFKNFPLELETLHNWNDRTDSEQLLAIKKTIVDVLQHLTQHLTYAISVADVKALEQEIETWNALAALDKTNPQQIQQWTRFQNMLPLIQEAKYFETLAQKYVQLLFAQHDFAKIKTLLDQSYVVSVKNRSNETVKFFKPQQVMSEVIAQYKALYEQNGKTWTFLFAEANKAFLTQLVGWAQSKTNKDKPEAQALLQFVDTAVLDELKRILNEQTSQKDKQQHLEQALLPFWNNSVVQKYLLSITDDKHQVFSLLNQYAANYSVARITKGFLYILTGQLPILTVQWGETDKNFITNLESLHEWKDDSANPHLLLIKQTIANALQQRIAELKGKTIADVKALEQEIETWNALAALDKTNPQQLQQWIRFQNMLPLIQEAKYFETLTQKYVQLLFAQRNFAQIKTLLDQGYVVSVKDRGDRTIKIFEPQSIMGEIIAQYKELYKQNNNTWTFLFAEANKDFLTQLVGWAQSKANEDKPEAQTLLQFVDTAILAELQRTINFLLENYKDRTLLDYEKNIADFLAHPAIAARINNNPGLKAQVEQQKQIALANKQAQVVQIFLTKPETTLDTLYTQLGITKLPRTIQDLVAIMTNIKAQAGDSTALLKAAQARLTKELQNIQQLLNDRDTSSWEKKKINIEVLQLINLIATPFVTLEGKLPEEISTVIDPILDQASKLITERVLTPTSLYLNKQDTTSGILNEQTNAIVASYHLLATFGNEAQKQTAEKALKYVKNDLFTAYLSAIAFSDKTVSHDWLERAKNLLNALGDSLIQTALNRPLTSPKDIRIASLKYLAILGYKDLLSTWIEGMNFNLIDGSTTRKPDLSDKKDLLEAEKAWAKTLPLDQRIEIEATIAVTIHEGKKLGNTEGGVELPEYFKTTENSQAVLARLDHLKQSVSSCQKLQQEIQTTNILTQQPSLDSTCIGFTVPTDSFTNFGNIFPKRAKSGSALSMELAQEEERVRNKGIFAKWRAIQSTAPKVPTELQTALASIGNAEVVKPEMVVALNSAIANMYCQQLVAYIKAKCADTQNTAAIIETINAIFNTSGKYANHYALILKYASEGNKRELAANIKVFLSPQTQTVPAELDQTTLNALGRSESSLVPAELIAKDGSLSEQLTTLSSSLDTLPQLMLKRQEQLAAQEAIRRVEEVFGSLSPTEQLPTTEQTTTVDPEIQKTIAAINEAIKSVVQNGDSFHLLNLYSNLLAYSEKFKDNQNMSQAIEQLIVKHFVSKDKLVQKFIDSLTTQRRLSRDPVLALRLDVADQTKDQDAAGIILDYYKQLLLHSSSFTEKERNQKLITLITMVFPDIEKTIESILRQQIILSSSRTDSAQQSVAKDLKQRLSSVTTQLAAIKDPKDGQISTLQITVNKQSVNWGWKYNAKNKTWISSSQDGTLEWIYDPTKQNQLVQITREIQISAKATHTTITNTYTDLNAYFDANTKVAASTTTTVYDLDKFNTYRRLMITALEDAAEQTGAETSLSYYATAIGGLYGQKFDALISQLPSEVVRAADERYEQQRSHSASVSHDEPQSTSVTKSVDIRARRHVSAPELLLAKSYMPGSDTTTLMKKQLAGLTQAEELRQEESAKAFAATKKDPHKTQQPTLPASRLLFPRSCASEVKTTDDKASSTRPLITVVEDYRQ